MRLPPNARHKKRAKYEASLASAISAIDNPRPGLPNPDGYGTIYAVAPNGDAFVINRKAYYDGIRTPRSGVDWAVEIKRRGDRRFEWNETYNTRREAVAWIRAEVSRIIESGNTLGKK